METYQYIMILIMLFILLVWNIAQHYAIMKLIEINNKQT